VNIDKNGGKLVCFRGLGFFLLPRNLLVPLKALANEFYQSYKPNEKVGKARGKEIVVDAQLFREIFKLLLLEIKVDGFKDIVPLHKFISRLEIRPKPLRMVGKWWMLVTQR
jgi:hypothetical protein